MSLIYNYFFNNTSQYEDDTENFTIIHPEKTYLNDIKSRPYLHPILQNKPRFNSHLQDILNVKLRPTIVNLKPSYYPPRNPVILELNKKFGIGL